MSAAAAAGAVTGTELPQRQILAVLAHAAAVAGLALLALSDRFAFRLSVVFDRLPGNDGRQRREPD
ncbi:hypothetical protein [Streptomyces sp. NPDC003635]